ncbi:hypothetical protein EYF80_043654 [Liparis tanakae]|uniref:Uncharacterized protein n=1 Tax=Liparis tanakae TaxID=230148 RepID=A0A4Z2FY43_9TELE|nr:hypothetical protein EYF80_043654 [Liparis tanakae]
MRSVHNSAVLLVVGLSNQRASFVTRRLIVRRRLLLLGCTRELRLDLLVGGYDQVGAERGVAGGEEHPHVGDHGRHLRHRQHVDPDGVIDPEEDHVQNHQGEHRFGRPGLRPGALRATRRSHLPVVAVEEQQDVTAGAHHQGHEGEVPHGEHRPVDHVRQVVSEVHVAEAQVEGEGGDGAVARRDGEKRGRYADGHVEEPQSRKGGEHQGGKCRLQPGQSGPGGGEGHRLEHAEHAGDADRQRPGDAVHVDHHLTAGVVQQVPHTEHGHGLGDAAEQDQHQVGEGQVAQDHVHGKKLGLAVDDVGVGQQHHQVAQDAHARLQEEGDPFDGHAQIHDPRGPLRKNNKIGYREQPSRLVLGVR